MDLVAFLRARLDEDEAVAKAATPGPWLSAAGEVQAERGNVFVAEAFFPNDPAHMARHDPARVLREVEAKRRIVERYADDSFPPEIFDIAAVYSDHPDYDEGWRP